MKYDCTSKWIFYKAGDSNIKTWIWFFLIQMLQQLSFWIRCIRFAFVFLKLGSVSKWKDVKDLKRKENEWNIFKDWISKTRFYPPLICQVWIKLRHSVWNVYQVNSAQICNTYSILQMLLCRVSFSFMIFLVYH